MRVKQLPLSGSEPRFTNRLWGRAVGIGSNNCYAYAVGDYESMRLQKSIPGERANIYKSHTYTNCKDLPRRVIADNPKKVYRVKAEDKCKKDSFKVMMFVAPGNKRNYFRQVDFHFYKQHGFVEYKVKKGNTHESIAKFFKVPVTRVKRAGKCIPGKLLKFKANVFSHKRGWATGPLLIDAKGKSITDREKRRVIILDSRIKNTVVHSVSKTEGSKSDTPTPKSLRILVKSFSFSTAKNTSRE